MDKTVWLTPHEVAEYLGVAISTLRQWRYLGTGPAFSKINPRIIRYRQSAIDQWLDAARAAG